MEVSRNAGWPYLRSCGSVILGHDRYFGHGSCIRILLANRNDVIRAHMARSGVGSVFGDAPAVALFNRPLGSAALRTFNDHFEGLRFSHMNGRFTWIDCH